MIVFPKISAAGDLIISKYTYEKIGDKVAAHVHSENDAHIIVVSRGQIELRIFEDDSLKDYESHILDEGDDADIPAGIWHEIIAKKNNSKSHHILRKLRQTPPADLPKP
jgi:quercetin dioxygenase-like cupin family protein